MEINDVPLTRDELDAYLKMKGVCIPEELDLFVIAYRHGAWDTREKLQERGVPTN